MIVFMGSSRRGPLSESEVRRQLAIQLGVPPNAILTNDRALTTREEARLAKELLEPRSVRTIVLVSDSLHLRRAQAEFEHQGFAVSTARADSVDIDATAPEDRLHLARIVAEQALAFVVYRLSNQLCRF